MTLDQKAPLAGTRILVIEDEYYLADDLSRALSGAGAEVVGPVGTLHDAESKVSEGGFDCAVVDMNLRGDFAYEVAERLGVSGVPFVVMTGYNQSSLPERLARVPRVEKPFAAKDVVDLIVKIRENRA